MIAELAPATHRTALAAFPLAADGIPPGTEGLRKGGQLGQVRAICPTCGQPSDECLCSEKDGITYLFWYDKKPARRAVARIKHGNNIVAARHIAALLAERLRDRSFDAVFYVPRSKKALRQYGFDQAELLAKCLSD